MLRRRVDEQEGDDDAEPDAVPGEPTPEPRPLAVAGRLVVLGGPELLGVEPKHDEEQDQPDRDERPGEDLELFHGRRLALVHPEHRQECLLRDLHRADPLHALLAFLLLLEQLALAGDVATVALGEDVLAHRPHRFRGR